MKAANVLNIFLHTQNDRTPDFDSRCQETDLQKHSALTVSVCDLSGQLSQKIQFIKFYIFIKFLPRYKRLPPGRLYLGSAIGHPGLDMVNVLDPLGLREKVGMSHNVMSHNSLVFFADVIEIFPELN